MKWLRKLFGGSVEPAPLARSGLDYRALASRAKPYSDIRFVADVLKHYRHNGTMSEKQAAALERIVTEREAQDRVPIRYLGPIGSEVAVEGEVVNVQYRGRGKSREGRYVIYCEHGVAVFDGPAILVGRLGVVKFRAKVISHQDGDTHVAEPRDVVVTRRPNEKQRS